MTQSIVINMDLADLRALLTQTQQEAYTAGMKAAKEAQRGFEINPDMIYALDNPDVIQLFGINNLKHPSQSLLKLLRLYGVDPLAGTGQKARAYGWQLLKTLEAIQLNITPHTTKN